MRVSKKIFGLFISLVLLATTSLAACEPGATDNSSGVQPPLTTEQILSRTFSANATLTTFKFSANITMNIAVAGGSHPLSMPVQMGIEAQIDTPAQSMRMAGVVSTTIPGVGEQTIPVDLYMVNGWMYEKIEIPKQGEQWVKLKIDPQQWQKQDQLAQQIEFLKTAANITRLQDENVDGTDCYVFSVNPDMKVLMNWVQQQNSSVNLTGVDLANAFKAFSIKEWLSKETFLPVKADAQINLEMSPKDAGAKATDFDKMTMDMQMVSRYFDYGKPVAIDLPATAANATDMSYILKK